MSHSIQAAARERDPWDRFGWVMGTAWLAFLTFPVVGALAGDRPVLTEVAAVGCIGVFAATYALGLVRVQQVERWRGFTGSGARYVTALVVLTVAAVSLVGQTALGMTPFVVAFAMFALPVRSAVALGVVTLGVVLVLPLSLESFESSWLVVPVVLAVGLFTGAVRVLEQRGQRHRQRADEIAMAAERDRVARDVHDVLGHSLTVISVKAELAERLVDLDPARARAELGEIQSLTRQSLAEIRATVAGLRVARLTEEIEAARSALAGAGIAAELPADPGVVDPRHRIVLAWSLREAVTNVVRHSGARRCTVTMGVDWLEVRDDGHGMDGRREGHGLRGLRERVRAGGGTVEIVPVRVGVGTVVRVQL